MNILNKLLKSDVALLGAIAFIICLFYGSTLLNGFVYDDVWLIEENLVIKDLSNLPKVFTGCISAGSSNECDKSGVYYRPIQNLQLMLTSQISQKPWVFHFASLLLLFCVSMGVFILLKKLLKSQAIAFIGAVLFLINPIISENVNLASALSEQYLAIFFILSFIFYIKYSNSNKIRYLFCSSIFYLLALFAKETAILLFLVFLSFDFLFKKFKFDRKIFVNLSFFICPLIIYSLVRYIILGNIVHNLTGYHALDQKTTLLTAIFTFPLYLSKLIFPWFLNAQPDPIIIKDINFNFVLGLVGWSIYFAMFYLAIRKRLKLMVLGLMMIFLSLLPIIIFIDKIGRFLFDEGRLFLSDIGLTLVIIDLYLYFVKKLKRNHAVIFKKSVIIVLIIYFLISWLVVFNRNRDWHDEFSFNKSIARYAKENDGVYYNLAGNYYTRGEFGEAVKSYVKAFKINPDFWEAHYNLANTYLELSKPNYAENEYKKVLVLNPSFVPAQNAKNNLEIIKSGTMSAEMQLMTTAIEFKDKDLKFNFPVQVSLLKEGRGFILKAEDFTAEIGIGNKNFVQETNLGGVINQGPADLPNFDKAYVRIFKSSLQFFLYKGDKVVNVVVNFTDPSFKGVFDKILGSISTEP